MNTRDSELGSRLRDARKSAGFRSANEAAEFLGLNPATYTHHENGTRAPGYEQVQRYADTFGVDPCWLMFGQDNSATRIANVPEASLHQIVTFVMSHDRATKAKPEAIADLIVDLCRHVGRSGMSGVEGVIDFQMHRRGMRRG